MNPFNIHLEWARDAPKIKNSKSTLNVIKRQNLVSRQRRNLYLMSKFLEIGLQIKCKLVLNINFYIHKRISCRLVNYFFGGIVTGSIYLLVHSMFLETNSLTPYTGICRCSVKFATSL